MTMIRDGAGEVITPSNPLSTRPETQAYVTPVEIQSRYGEPISTHNAVVNPSSSLSAWIYCDGVSEMVFNSNLAVTIQVQYSLDGVNQFSFENLASATVSRLTTALPYVRFSITGTGTISAAVYLKA